MSLIADHLDLLMIAGVLALLLSGYPVAFALGGGAVLFALLGAAFEVGLFAGGDLAIMQALFLRIFGIMDSTSEVLLAVPLFIVMGVTLERSKVAAELLETMGRLFGGLPGGLGVSVILVGALLAASTGIVGATVVAMGLISLPTMLRNGYSAPLACGAVAASGTLGQIIPPSIVLVILGDTISNAWLEARRAAGDWSPDPVTVGDLFAGAMIPGLLLVGLYLVYLMTVALIRPGAAPALAHARDGAPSGGSALLAVLPTLALSIGVLGSILAGAATPTEAAAVGAVGAMLIAGARLRGSERKARPEALAASALVAALLLAMGFDLRLSRPDPSLGDRVAIAAAAIACAAFAVGLIGSLLSLHRTRTEAGLRTLADIGRQSLSMTAMVFAIFIGAQAFVLVFRALGGDHAVESLLTDIPGGPWVVFWSVMAVMFLLGFLLDFLEITFVVVPLVAPVLFGFTDASGAPVFHPVWLAVMIAVNLQTSFLTPPFGFALFYLRGAAPAEVTTLDIWKGALPFVLLQLAALGLVAAWPQLATWLPGEVG